MCGGPRVGIRKFSPALWTPKRVQAVEASVSLFIKWKQALHFVCLAGGGGGEASCYYKPSLKMGGLAYSQSGLGPERAVAAAASGLGLTSGFLGHYMV